MNDIFKYLKPQENQMLQDMHGSELQDFLQDLAKFYLNLRTNLKIAADITFGLEIECDKLDLAKVRKWLSKANLYNLNKSQYWQVDIDMSLKHGGEVISPILRDNVQTWQELSKVCTMLHKYAKLEDKAGGHIHVGAQIFRDYTYFWQFLKIWMAYENIIYRFGYGEYLTERPSLIHFAEPVAYLLKKEYPYWENIINETPAEEFLSDVIDVLHHRFYQKSSRNEAFNLNNIKSFKTIAEMNTIEFRCPNASINPVIWQNNVNLFLKMIINLNRAFASEEIIIDRIKKIKQDDCSLYWYREIYLDQALEFCDLVFDNNLDKIYFLKQYLKSGKTADKALVKSPKFTCLH